MEYSINVCVESKCSTTQKGNLLENLTAEIMKVQQYNVVKTIRVTGMELDLLARHNYSGEEIIVECKAWEDNINADVISKLLGNVFLNNASAGWLISTGGLGKDAEGLRVSWEKKPYEERKKLTIYTADRIINLLIDNKIVVNPETFLHKLPVGFISNSKVRLFITNIGRFWLAIGGYSSGEIINLVIAFEATTGNRVTDIVILNRLKNIKSIYSEYEWVLEKDRESLNNKKLNSEFQDIVTVMPGDAWTDYRPSRPKDYVGRKGLIKNIYDYFAGVLNNQTDTRLFAIKSPSGWGKSSTLLKIIEESKMRKNRDRYYIYAVDVRTALSSRYAELAFKNCLENAIKDKFIDIGKNEVEIGDISNITDTQDVKTIIDILQKNNKVLILIFDQFEEIFYKEELFELFDNVKRISNTIDSIKENLIIGFAWKTDFSIASDHPAYYLWSNLKDRRKEFDLFQFTDSEIKGAIKIFGSELGEKINPVLARYLLRQCQGYPWLLKKLCIHVFNIVKDGKKQEEAIEQTFNIGSLFDREITELTSQEFGCIQQIAKESPADYFKIVETFGNETLQSLINKRTVIKRSTKLTLYWDIFRDYIIYGKLPEIIIDYIPQVQFSTFAKVITVLIEKNGKVKIDDLSKETLLGRNTIDNILIDLVMFGVIDRDRDKIGLKDKSIENIIQSIKDFFKRHIVWVSLQKQKENEFNINDYNKIFSSLYSMNNLSDKTQKIYSNRFLGWLLDIKMVTELNQVYFYNLKNESIGSEWLISKNERKIWGAKRGRRRTRGENRNSTVMYWPQVSPQKVSLFYLNYNDKKKAADLIAEGNKKVLEDLISLRTASVSIEDEVALYENCAELYNKVSKKENIFFAMQQLKSHPDMTVKQMAEIINNKFDKNWSEGTSRVTGGMIYRWARELIKIEKDTK